MNKISDFMMSLQDKTGMTEQELKDFDRASSHPYTCACKSCDAWWKLLPPEDDDRYND